MSQSRPSVVAIVGRANVGKSSLFNAIIGRREAIVADEPGTTRDRVVAKASWHDKDFWLVDTAGLKSADDDFELTIQEQIVEATDSADVIIVVVEANLAPTEEDRRVATMALKSRKPVILAANKADRARGHIEEWLKLGIKDIIPVSAIHKTGLDELLNKATGHLGQARIKSDQQTIHVGILGRPNVGKSSLFNSLAKKQQAIVADRPGTTRDVNRLSLTYHGQQIELMDTAGIRRSGKIEPGVEKFSVLRALAAIDQSDVCLLLMDATEASVGLDQKIAGLIKEAGRGLVLIVNKWDKLEGDSLARDRLSAQIADEFAFVPWAPLIFTSAVSGQNVTKIFELAAEIYQTRQGRITTPQLNRWLRKATAEHPPPGTAKLNYMVQEESIDLPSFKIFGKNTKTLHFSYRRYLERQFRTQWPFAGTPIKFWFISGEQRLK